MLPRRFSLHLHLPLPLPLRRLPPNRHFHYTPRPQLLDTTLTATHTLLTTLHTTTHLPWYALIPSTAVLLRALITTPTTIYSRLRAFRTLELQPLIAAWQHPIATQARATTKTPQEWEKVTRRELRKKRSEVYKRHGCQRWKAFVAPLLQLPVWVVVSLTVRGMAGRDGGAWFKSASPTPETDTLTSPFADTTSTLTATREALTDTLNTLTATAAERLIPIEESFSTEGTLWFPNLLEADPTFVLPMLFSFLMYANVEMQAALHPATTRGQRILTNTLRIVPWMALPMIMDMPAALTLYWATSAGYSLIQNGVLAVVMPRPEVVEGCKRVNPYTVGDPKIVEIPGEGKAV